VQAIIEACGAAPEIEALVGASLAAAVSRCQNNGVIPAGVVKRITVAR